MGLSSLIPGAIKLVSGFPVALATEQRAIVGELVLAISMNAFKVTSNASTYLLEITSVK